VKFFAKFEVLLQKQFLSVLACFQNQLNRTFLLAESEKIRYVYSTEILQNTATIREVNSTEIDSNFMARETQDYAPLQRQTTNNQTNFHNFKARN